MAGAAAETPRVLDVRDFTQARETELRYLLQAVRQEVGEGRFGAPLLPRHLRRRATSHRRFIVRRRPNLRLAALYGTSSKGGGAGAGGGGEGGRKRARPGGAAGATALGPGDAAIATRAAAAESRSSVLAVSSAAGVETPPTRSSDAPRGPAFDSPQEPTEPPRRPTSRGMRRRPARLQAAAEASCACDLAPPQQQQRQQQQRQQPCRLGEQQHQQQHQQQPQGTLSGGGEVQAPHLGVALSQIEVDGGGGSAAAEAGGQAGGSAGGGCTAAAAEGPLQGGGSPHVRRLETHVWHARRMAMEHRWGHLLAAHSAGRGRGSRSLMAQLRLGALLHDSSYVGCVELSGHQRDLAVLLRRVSDPVRLDELLDRPEVISGAAEWPLFLHLPGAFPRGPLAPARALWLSPPADDEQPSLEPQPPPQPPQPQLAPHPASSAAPPSTSSSPSSPSSPPSRPGVGIIDGAGWATSCVLWLWVHAAAFQDVWGALHQAAEVQTAETGCSSTRETMVPNQASAGGSAGPLRGGISIRSRCPDLRRIDVVGAAAGAALARVLQPLVAGGETLPGAVAEAYGGEGTVEGAELGGSIWRSVWGSGESGGGGGCSGWRCRWRWRWPAGAVVGMVARHPQLAAPVKVGAVEADAMGVAAGGCGRAAGDGEGGGLGQQQQQQEQQEQRRRRSGVLLQEAELRRQLRQWPEGGDWTSGAEALWRRPWTNSNTAACGPARVSERDPADSPATSLPAAAATAAAAAAAPPVPLIPPPLAQADVAAARRIAREQLLRAGLGAGPSAGGGGGVARPGPEAVGCSASFPVLLIRRPGGAQPPGATCRGGACGPGDPASAASAALAAPGGGGGGGSEAGGWSVVLPARWVMPVWLALAFTGARPTGQLEWRQLAAHFRTPCFPYDHPYTPAGERYNRERLGELAAAASRRPLGRARKAADSGPLADWSRLMTLLDTTSPRLPPADLRGRPRSSSRPVSQPAGGCAGGTTEMAAAPPPAHPPTLPTLPAAEDGDGGGEGHTAADAPGAAAPAPGGSSRGRTDDVTAGRRRGRAGGADVSGWALGLREGVLRAALAEEGREGYGGGLRQKQQRRGPASGSCLHGWSLRKALRLGLVSPPVAPPSQPQQGQQGQGQGQQRQEQQQGQRQGCGGQVGLEAGPRGRCLVYVALRVEARGVCEAGAEVVALYATEAGAAVASAEVVVPPAPAPTAPQAPRSGDVAVVVGYVVSGATRGSPSYPGGLAVCDASGLGRLLAEQRKALKGGWRQQQQQQLQLPLPTLLQQQQPEQLIPRGGLEGGGEGTPSRQVLPPGAGGRGGGRGTRLRLRLWLRNPGSSALRECGGEVLLQSREGDQVAGVACLPQLAWG